MTDSVRAGHTAFMGAMGGTALLHPSDAKNPAPAAIAPDFEKIYVEYFDYVWRALRRLGGPQISVDDAAQDVFVVVHRKLDRFEGRSSVKTWVYGIAVLVARDHRRRQQRKGGLEPLDESQMTASTMDPEQAAERLEALEVLDRILERLDEGKREVFVLAEIEQLTAPEISQALGLKLNTVYSRLRLARARFAELVDQFQRTQRRQR